MEIVLVTGANRGIGLALTRVLLASGNVVIAGCRRPDESDELKQLTLLHPETIDLIKCDIDREKEMARQMYWEQPGSFALFMRCSLKANGRASPMFLPASARFRPGKATINYAYSTSKAALNMLTRGIADELAPRRVTTVAISPGWVRTDMGGEDAALSSEESARSLAETIKKLGPELNGQFLDRNGRVGEYRW